MESKDVKMRITELNNANHFQLVIRESSLGSRLNIWGEVHVDA